MKIALISFYLMETTIPLAKHLKQLNLKIDLYSLLPYGNQNCYVFNFSNTPQKNGFVDSQIIKKTVGDKLLNYLSGVGFRIFIYPDRWFQKIFFKDFYYAYKLAKFINKEKYDKIHIIHSSKRFWLCFYLFLEKRKVIQTLHEVTSHEGKTTLLDSFRLKWMINNQTPVIVHSNISEKRFKSFMKVNTKNKISEYNLKMIRFGLFETYRCFSVAPSKPSGNFPTIILTYGRIVPSKGINILVEAVKIVQEKYPIHLIIAGNGTPYFELSGVKSYEFLNRFISNEEVIELIERCDMVVLPYISASQSGVPMTVYAFDKPIIASNIAGLKEVIDHMSTGILVDDINPESFSKAIEQLISNRLLKSEIIQNIKNKYSKDEYSWEHIAKQTLCFYNKIR